MPHCGLRKLYFKCKSTVFTRYYAVNRTHFYDQLAVARWLRLNVSFMFSRRKSASLIKLNTKIYSVHCSTTLHRVFLYIKVEFEPSFLPIGKPGRKTSPVDCVITHKNCIFQPKQEFTQTAMWHGIRVKAEINKLYLDINPIEQCGASASEDLKFRRW